MRSRLFCKRKSDMKKAIAIICAVLVVVLGLFLYFKFWFVYSSGVNEGDINYFQREGFIFKTYEGKMIQSGFKANGANTNGLRSNEFKFSVTNKAVADSLMRCSGKRVELKWNRYLGTLPWRGESQYIATEILSVE